MKQKQPITHLKKKILSVSLGVAEQPSTKINKGKGIISFGSNNLYSQHLVDLYESSPTHGAIINGKVKYIFGKGLDSKNLPLKNWLQRANKRESWNDLFFKLTLDYEIHNRFYIEVVRTRDNGKRYYHLDAAKIRLSDDEESYVYCDNWAKSRKVDMEVFNIHNPYSNAIIRDEDGRPYREIIPYDEYRPNFDYYAYPNYLNVITSIATEKEICNYDLNQWAKGFSGATLINLNNGSPETEEEEADLVRTIKNTIGGSGGDNILVNFADNKETAAEIVGVKGENSAVEADMTAKRVQATIFTGHTVTNSALFGVKEAGQLGGRNEILEAYELFKETYVSIRQNRLVSFIEDISGLDGLEVIELSPIKVEEEEVVVVEDETKFSSNLSEEEQAILDECDKEGFSKKGHTVIAKNGCTFKDGKLEFANLGLLSLWILAILRNNPKYSAKEIVEEANLNDAGLDIGDVFIEIGKLATLGWILGDGSSYELTNAGKEEADNAPLPEVELETVYSYELRPDAQELVPGSKGSRTWCKEMMAKDKYYTREAIDRMSNSLGTNVWLTRGGWMGKAGTDSAFPFCRHWWVQTVISKGSDNSNLNIER